MMNLSSYVQKFDKPLIWTAVIFFIITLFLFSFQFIDSNDFWWQLAIGKWIVENGIVMHNDVFSYTFAGGFFNNPHWMFGVVMFTIYENWSYIGLNIFRFIILASAYFFIYKSAKIKNKVHPVLILAIFFVSLFAFRYFMRSGLSLYSFIFIFIYILYKGKYDQSKLLYALPFIQAIWVNSNGGYIFGPVLVGIFLGSELLRSLIKYKDNILQAFKKNKLLIKYIITFVGTLIGLLFSSYGFGVLNFIGNHFNFNDATSEATHFISEWVSSPFSSFLSFGATDRTVLAVLFWLCIIALIFRLIRYIKENGYSLKILQNLFYEDILLVALALYLTLKHMRFAYLFVLLVGLILLRNYKYLPKILNKNNVVYIILILSFTTLVYAKAPNFALDRGPKIDRYPEHSIEFIKQNNIKGPILNDYGYGGYLIWNLREIPVFIDGRTPNLYSNDFYWYYRHLSSNRVFDHLYNTYDFNLILVSNSSGVSTRLRENENWSLVFFDNVSSVYLDKNGSNQDVIETASYEILNPSLSASSYLDICDKKEEKAKLIAETDINRNALPRPIFSLVVLSNLMLNCENASEDDFKNGLDITQDLVMHDSDNSRNQLLLGNALLKNGNDLEALNAYEKSTM